MPAANTSLHYGSVARTLHWLTALFILTLIPLGYIANQLPYETPEQLNFKAWLFSLHKTMGLAAFTVAILRIVWAVSQPKPAPLHPDRKLEHLAAETVHWLLYGSLVLVPLTGWIHHAATTGFAPIWWPFGQNLPFVPKDDAFAKLFGGLHLVFSYLLALSVGAHIAGALKHHVIDKDATLRRMLSDRVSLPDLLPSHPSRLPLVMALAVWAVALGLGSVAGVYSKHQSSEIASVELEEAASDWVREAGEIAIEVTQFGSKVSGQFAEWTPQIAFDPEVSEGKAGEVMVQIAIGSLTLGSVTNEALGADFFAAEDHPVATYAGDIMVTEGGYEVPGTLTIKGNTVPVTLPFSLDLEGDLASMTAQTQINRLDFGVGAHMPDESSLGFAVDISIKLTARQAQ